MTKLSNLRSTWQLAFLLVTRITFPPYQFQFYNYYQKHLAAGELIRYDALISMSTTND